MNDTLLRYWWMLALRGGIAIAFGMLALLLPGLTVLSFIALFSAYALFSGALSTIGAIKNRKSDDHWWLLLMAGLVGLGAGLIALLYPALTGARADTAHRCKCARHWDSRYRHRGPPAASDARRVAARA